MNDKHLILSGKYAVDNLNDLFYFRHNSKMCNVVIVARLEQIDKYKKHNEHFKHFRKFYNLKFLCYLNLFL